ncbi:hypothetical protein [Nocardioides sp. MH1]|uniref:hypothetical protein n=1 Tax=Nocardioides sp. MH1 TaxID=3242490 RepID=UPI0035223E03
MSAGPRIARMSVSNRGVGLSSGIGPFSAWTGVRYPRLNQITVGGAGGPRYLTEPMYDPHAVEMKSVAGLDALALTPTAPDDLVSQLNAADKPLVWSLVVAAGAAGLLLAGIASVSGGALVIGIVLFLLSAIAIAIAVLAYRKESIEHLVPVEYTLEGDVPAWATRVEHTWASLDRLGGAWRIIQSGKVETLYQHKTNAGASYLIGRAPVSFGLAPPKVLAANITVPSLSSGSTTLYFLPDRVLMRTGRKWTDVAYEHLRVDVHRQRFIEDHTPPRDASQVGTTWQYVNKGGGPDRRFKNNRQLPIMLYGRVTLSSAQGLSWILDLSVTSVAESLGSCLSAHPA